MATQGWNSSILDEILDEAKAQLSLQAYGFTDWKTALAIFRRLESRDRPGLMAIFPFLVTALGSSADPGRALINLERFMDGYGSDLFLELDRNPRIIEILITLFSSSPFLTEIMLRSQDTIGLLNDRLALTERKTIEQFQEEAISVFRPINTETEKLDALRRYQRRQYLRIGTSDFLGLFDLSTVFSQLSRMAIGLVRACLVLSMQQTGITTAGFSVLALGKLGGRELNYSSDIDLLFLTRENSDEHVLLAKKLVENIASTTPEGFLYRVDLRLRPWGNDGSLLTTSEGFLTYIKKQARLWEKQAFLKARPIAGNLSFGEEVRTEIEPFLFHAPADEVRASIFAMKQRTEEFLKEKGRNWGEVKLGEGSIRDIEFVVQFLQMTNPDIRTRATLKAIPRMRAAGLIESSEARILSDGYNFLRTIEHYLQMIDYRQTNTLPSDPAAIANLARRFGFEGLRAAGLFLERYKRHSLAIRSIFLKYVGNVTIKESGLIHEASSEVLQHIAQMDASYSTTFTFEEVQMHAELAERINSQTIALVDASPLENGRWRVTVVGYDYPGELALICGLLFVYGLDILECQAFTYEPSLKNTIRDSIPIMDEVSQTDLSRNKLRTRAIASRKLPKNRRKIVDVFIVRSVNNKLITPELWSGYAEDLRKLLMKMEAGQRRNARGDLAKRVGEVFQGMTSQDTTLYPIDLEIDNDSSDIYTVINIGTPDTVGFLYEFSNALAMNHINIARMFIRSIGDRVSDTFFVTDDAGKKIISPEKQRELRAATVLIKHFTHLLPHSPNPAAALLHFREFLGQLFKRPNWPDELVKLERPEVLDALAKLLGESDFLWSDFLRMQYSNLFPLVRDVDDLVVKKGRQALSNELGKVLSFADDWRVEINSFKDREMFRIDMRHILGRTTEFWDFSQELTDLVEVVIINVLTRCDDELSGKYGRPQLEAGGACRMALFALGKCGGRELGFASDIELLLVYEGQGKSSGSNIIPTSRYFEELIQSMVNSVQALHEGIFHIDLQLRPYGKAGSLAVSLDAFKHYFDQDGPAWAYERQALVKMRSIAGEQAFAEQICALRDEFVYNGKPFNVTAMRAMREKQIRHLVSAGTFNAKYSPGGLVDLEYLVQGLQITYGAEIPSLRVTNTRMAISGLYEAGVLNESDYVSLRKAHTFLRWLIDSLRVVRGNTKDVNIPPDDTDEFAFLARRMRYGAEKVRLQQDLMRFTTEVQELNSRYLPAP